MCPGLSDVIPGPRPWALHRHCGVNDVIGFRAAAAAGTRAENLPGRSAVRPGSSPTSASVVARCSARRAVHTGRRDRRRHAQFARHRHPLFVIRAAARAAPPHIAREGPRAPACADRSRPGSLRRSTTTSALSGLYGFQTTTATLRGRAQSISRRSKAGPRSASASAW